MVGGGAERGGGVVSETFLAPWVVAGDLESLFFEAGGVFCVGLLPPRGELPVAVLVSSARYFFKYTALVVSFTGPTSTPRVRNFSNSSESLRSVAAAIIHVIDAKIGGGVSPNRMGWGHAPISFFAREVFYFGGPGE